MRTATYVLMVMTLFACVQWADANVVAKWTFDDGTATDLVGANDGVAVGNVAAGSEGSRHFLNFDEGYVNFGDLGGALVGSSFSIEYTFRRNSAGWEFMGSGNYNFIRLCCGGISWGWGLGCQNPGGNCGGHLNANHSIGNDWVHMVTTYDQPTKTQSVYFDGELIGTNTAFDDFGTIPPQNPSDDDFIVGAVSGTGNGGGWYQVPGWTQGNGDIDEVVVHDEVIVPPFTCEDASLAFLRGFYGECAGDESIVLPILTDCETIQDTVFAIAIAVAPQGTPTRELAMLEIGSAVLDNTLETATVCGDIAPGGSESDACRASILHILNNLP
jgi:hypothetical protein